MKLRLAVLGLLALMIPGCAQVQQLETLVTTPEYLEKGAKIAVTTALNYELKKLAPDQVARVIADCKAIDASIKADVIPWFDGTKTDALLVSIVDDVLAKLTGKTTGIAADITKVAIGVIGASVPLPDVPTEKISDATKAQILGVLKGLSTGLEAVIAKQAEPAPVVNPTARSAPAPVWPHSKRQRAPNSQLFPESK